MQYYSLILCINCSADFVFVLQAVSASKGKDAKMDWEAIHGLMEDAIYGGRIDNAYDLRVLKAYLR